MTAGLASPSGGDHQQGNDEHKPRGQTEEGNDVDDGPEPFGKVRAVHATPGANDDGEEREETEPHRAGDDGGEDLFTPRGWRRFKG